MLPHVAWLKPFRFPGGGLGEDRRRRLGRTINITAGLEIVGLGPILPLGYVTLSVVTFSAIDPATLRLLVVAGALCVGLGICALFRA